MARKPGRWQWRGGGAPRGGKGVRGQKEAWELGCVRRGMRRGPRGAYIGPGGEGRRLPAAMAINGHAALMGIQEGGRFKEGKRLIDGGRVKGGFTAA
jgi:hypothetical protein